MSYQIDEKTNVISVCYGLQYITLPQGIWYVDTKPQLIEKEYYPDSNEVKTATYYHTTKLGEIFSYTLDHSFGVSYFPNNIHFEESHESYLYRLIDPYLPQPTAHEDVVKDYRAVDIYNESCHTFVKGDDDEYILVIDGKLRTQWKFSGDEDYPLGQLLWAEFSSPWSAQYLGDNKSIDAEPVLIWSYRLPPVSKSINTPKPFQRPAKPCIRQCY